MLASSAQRCSKEYPRAEDFEFGGGEEHVVTHVLLARLSERASHRHEAFGAPQKAQVMHPNLYSTVVAIAMKE